jgi:hypothetical protein
MHERIITPVNQSRHFLPKNKDDYRGALLFRSQVSALGCSSPNDDNIIEMMLKKKQSVHVPKGKTVIVDRADDEISKSDGTGGCANSTSKEKSPNFG